MSTTFYKYAITCCFFAFQLLYSQKGVESLLIKEGVLLKCDNQLIPSDGRIELPRTVKTIAAEAFKNCKQLKSISFAGTITSVGDSAFARCASLTKVEMMPNSVTEIGAKAFAHCPQLASITLPNSVATIGQEAFKGCTALESVEIPEQTTLIGDAAFAGCLALKKVQFLSTRLPFIPSQMFYECKQLQRQLLFLTI